MQEHIQTSANLIQLSNNYEIEMMNIKNKHNIRDLILVDRPNPEPDSNNDEPAQKRSKLDNHALRTEKHFRTDQTEKSVPIDDQESLKNTGNGGDEDRSRNGDQPTNDDHGYYDPGDTQENPIDDNVENSGEDGQQNNDGEDDDDPNKKNDKEEEESQEEDEPEEDEEQEELKLDEEQEELKLDEDKVLQQGSESDPLADFIFEKDVILEDEDTLMPDLEVSEVVVESWSDDTLYASSSDETFIISPTKGPIKGPLLTDATSVTSSTSSSLDVSRDPVQQDSNAQLCKEIAQAVVNITKQMANPIDPIAIHRKSKLLEKQTKVQLNDLHDFFTQYPLKQYNPNLSKEILPFHIDMSKIKVDPSFVSSSSSSDSPEPFDMSTTAMEGRPTAGPVRDKGKRTPGLPIKRSRSNTEPIEVDIPVHKVEPPPDLPPRDLPPRPRNPTPTCRQNFTGDAYQPRSEQAELETRRRLHQLNNRILFHTLRESSRTYYQQHDCHPKGADYDIGQGPSRVREPSPEHKNEGERPQRPPTARGHNGPKSAPVSAPVAMKNENLLRLLGIEKWQCLETVNDAAPDVEMAEPPAPPPAMQPCVVLDLSMSKLIKDMIEEKKKNDSDSDPKPN